jgi:glyoxylate carboligase
MFGDPGDGINGFLGALHESDLEFIQTRHEEIVAFAGTAHAKLTGELGVGMSTSDPGAIHLDTLVVADGFLCKTQVGQLSHRRPLHTGQLIKLAMEHGPDGPPGNRPERD